MEELETRLALYAAEASWASPEVTYSFVPDGTNVAGVESVMFEQLDALGAQTLMQQGDFNQDEVIDILDVAAVSAAWGDPGFDIFAVAEVSNNWSRTATDVWQDEIRAALDKWSAASGLTFTEVEDDGSAAGALGEAQGDPRFGDIRFSMAEAGQNFVGYGYYPSQASTLGGDIIFDDDYTWRLDGRAALFDVAIHEIGHALGLGHSSTSQSVMWSTIRDYIDLYDDDVEGIQFLYGPPF